LDIALLLCEAFNESTDILHTPCRCPGAKFDGGGILSGFDSFPELSLADGNDGKNLREADKAFFG